MTNEITDEIVTRMTYVYKGLDVNWTRVEGIVAVGALLTSFLWFVGMPTGMAIAVGFGVVLLIDFVRSLIFGLSRSERAELDKAEFTRH